MIWVLVSFVFLTNLLFSIVLIFFEKKQLQSIFAWIFVFTILPIIGVFLYLLFGNGIGIKDRIQIKKKKRFLSDYINFSKQDTNLKKMSKKQQKLIQFVKSNDEFSYFSNNQIKIFTSGNEKFDELKHDLLNAKHSINLEYYIFCDDTIGSEMMYLLCKKALQGVKVKIIYDAIGSANKKFFNKLKKCGGEVKAFFPSLFNFKFLSSKLNYRNHKKIVIIDGKIGYVGGINIRDDHLGKNNRISPWRDTHIKIIGDSVCDLQNIFFNDWRFLCKKNISTNQLISLGYLTKNKNTKFKTGVQILTSGPEVLKSNIEDLYIYLLNNATKYVYIQTPYLILDDKFIKAIELAKQNNVNIKIMIPGKPDKKSVFYATLFNVKKLIDFGVEIYMYNGFIHSKTFLVDNLVCSIGSCNLDIRSFNLNFEITALLYGKNIISKNKNIFVNDLKNCTKISKEFFNRRFYKSRFLQTFFNLFSQIM